MMMRRDGDNTGETYADASETLVDESGGYGSRASSRRSSPVTGGRGRGGARVDARASMEALATLGEPTSRSNSPGASTRSRGGFFGGFGFGGGERNAGGNDGRSERSGQGRELASEVELPKREIDYKQGGVGRVGLKPGDVVAFVTPDEGYPYACEVVVDESRDGEKKYKFVVDENGKGSSAGLREREAAQLEVLEHNGYTGFRCAYAHDRLLQATRHARSRLGFASANFGTWEEWVIDQDERRKLGDSAWTRVEITLKHRRLDAYRLKVTMVRLGRVVGAGAGDGETEEYKLGPSTSRHSTPGGTTRSLSAVDRWRLSQENAGPPQMRGRPHAMHAMGGALMKEWAAALEKEVAARKIIEQELQELHEADDKLREWALSELNRLRAFAQNEVDSLASEVEERNKKMADLKQQRRALELRAKMLENLDEERLNSIVTVFRNMQRGNALRHAFAHWRRESGVRFGGDKVKLVENAFATYQSKEYNKRLLRRVLTAWRQDSGREKHLRKVYSSVLNRYAYVAFHTWANEMRSNKLRREVAERVAPSRRIGVHLNNALTIGFQMRGTLKEHHLRRCFESAAKKSPRVRVDLVTTAFDSGEETENAATYKLTDALSDPLGAINLARQSVLRHVEGDAAAEGAVSHAFDQGITIASRMIQLRYTYIWDNADTIEEAMLLTSAFDIGESIESLSSQNRAMARGKLVVDAGKMAPREARLFMGAFYRGNFSRDHAEARKATMSYPDAFSAGLEAGLCRYKRTEFTSQGRSPEEARMLACAFDGGIASACLSTNSSSHARVQMLVESVEDEANTATVRWMSETLMRTVEIGAGNVSTSSTEYLLHKILYPLRTDIMRAAFQAWFKYHKVAKEEKLLVDRFVQRTNRRLKKEVLFAWRNATVLKKKRQVILQNALCKMKNAKMGAAFDAWANNTSKLVSDRVKLTKFITRATRRSLAMAFTTWAQVSTKRDKRLEMLADVMNKRMHRMDLAKAFAGWAEKAFTAINNRQRASAFLVRHRQQTVSKAFNAWYDNAQESKTERRKVQKVIFRVQNRVMSKAFYQWADLVATKARRAILVDRFVKKYRFRARTAAFYKWAEVARESKLRHAVLTKTFSRIKKQHLARAFNRWREFAAESYDAKVQLRKIVSRMLRLKLSQSFTRWQEQTIELRRQRAVIARFVSRIRNRCVTSCFYAWKEGLEDRKRSEQASSYRDRIINNVIARSQRSTLRAAMDKWKSVVEERELHRELIRRNLRSKRVAMNFFMSWYWDAFDGDLQDQIDDMFGATRTFMNQAFDEGAVPGNALDFAAYADMADDVGESPPPPSWGAGSGSVDDDATFHTPSRVRRGDDDHSRTQSLNLDDEDEDEDEDDFL